MKIRGVVSRHDLALSCLIGGFLLVSVPFVLHDAVGVGYMIPINYDEGWNAYHTSRLQNGGPLYMPIVDFPLTPVNYPPLSFLVVSVLGGAVKDTLLAGKVIALVSLLFVTYLVFRIVAKIAPGRPGPLLGALLWLALMGRMSAHSVGTYEPQMLGHVFSMGALYLYFRWVDELDFQKTCALATLCCFGLFVKLNLVTVPITLATVLLVSNRRRFWTFSLAGGGIFLLMVLGSWLYAGNNFFSNFIESDRVWSVLKMLKVILRDFGNRRLLVLFLPFIVLLFRYRRNFLPILLYFAFSFLIGALVIRGAGVANNAWFDFFIAASIVFGLLVSEWMSLKDRLGRIVVYGVLACSLLPFSFGPKSLERVRNYAAFQHDEEVYREDVELLRSIPGPALFEDPLLGFAAKKEFLFDPFAGSQIIASGRVPERILTDRIRERYFGAIVLTFDLEELLGRYIKAELTADNAARVLDPPATPRLALVTERWTEGTLKAISRNYELLDQPPRYYVLKPDRRYYFYLPRRWKN